MSSRTTAMLPSPAPTGASDRLLLFAIRRMAAGGLGDAHAASAFVWQLGKSYRRPLVLARVLMAEMAASARTPIAVAPCCCPRMTPAEGLILGAVADACDDPATAVESLALVMGVDAPGAAYGSAEALNRAFADLGRPLAR